MLGGMTPPTPLHIVTGGSRGLGLAVAQRLLRRGDRVLTLARGTPVMPPSPQHEHWAVDLAEPAPVAVRLEAWLESLPLGAVTLINNAAVVTDPAPLADTAIDALMQAARVGLEAPLVLTAAFLRATRGRAAGARKVLFVSSGLGRRPMAGAAAYCAVKAGLDHLARALALDEAALGDGGARVVSLAPGVIDTDMQVQLRNADPARFAERARFVELAATGQLDSPDRAAARLVAYLDRADFGSQPVADVRDA